MPRENPLRGQTRVSQRRLGCLSAGPSEVRSTRLLSDDTAVVGIGLNFQRDLTAESREQTSKCPEHHLRIRFRTRSLIRFARTIYEVYFLRSDQNLKL